MARPAELWGPLSSKRRFSRVTAANVGDDGPTSSKPKYYRHRSLTSERWTEPSMPVAAGKHDVLTVG